MSTTFAIIQKHKEPSFYEGTEELNVDLYPHGEVEEIAFRTNSSIIWTVPMAIWTNLENTIKVYPIDNTPQGVYTIGDLKDIYYGRNK